MHTEEQIRYTVDAMAEELEKIDPTYSDPRQRGKVEGATPAQRGAARSHPR